MPMNCCRDCAAYSNGLCHLTPTHVARSEGDWCMQFQTVGSARKRQNPGKALEVVMKSPQFGFKRR
jgi:hypothetical protein